jgi:predicted nucleic acid-binding protein
VTVLGDTSAFFAFLDRDDDAHPLAVRAWLRLRESGDACLTTNYVVTETIALLQNRLGLAAVAVFVNTVLPALQLEWVTPEVHDAAVETLLASNRRDLSLVDCVSFATMRRLGVRQAFTLDAHFREQSFDCMP